MNTIQLPPAMRNLLFNVALFATVFVISTCCEATEPQIVDLQTGMAESSCLEPTVAGPIAQAYDPISIYRDG
jgi:hypothetical protein